MNKRIASAALVGEGEDYTPLTAEQVQGFVPDTTYDEAKVGKFIETATAHKLSPDAAQAMLGLSNDLIAAPPKAPEYTPITAEALKGFYGEEAKLSDDQTTAFLNVATEHKLSEDTIKALVTFDQGRIKAAGEAGEAEWNATQAGWKTELEKDSLLTAGDGYEQNLANIAKVIKDYGGEANAETKMNELQEMLNVTGAGNHPAMGRFMMRVFSALPKEGRPPAGGGANPPGGGALSDAEILFPSMRKD